MLGKRDSVREKREGEMIVGKRSEEIEAIYCDGELNTLGIRGWVRVFGS